MKLHQKRSFAVTVLSPARVPPSPVDISRCELAPHIPNHFLKNQHFCFASFPINLLTRFNKIDIIQNI